MKNQDIRDAEAYCASGAEKYRLKDYQGAIADYSKAIKIDPDNAIAYKGSGNAHYMLKQYSEALPNFMMAIMLGEDVSHEHLNKCGWVTEKE